WSRSMCSPPARRQRCTSTARGATGFSAHRNTSLNWTMPELVNSRVGSLAGTSGAEGTTAWPRAAKNSRKSLRISEVVFIGGSAWSRRGREGLQPEATRLSVADRAPHAVAPETAAVEEVGRLAPARRGVHAAAEAAGHQVAGAPFPVVLAG